MEARETNSCISRACRGQALLRDALSWNLVIDAKPDYKVLARNEIASDTSRHNATPAIAGNALYVRTDSKLCRIEK